MVAQGNAQTPSGWLTGVEEELLKKYAQGRALEIGTWRGKSASVISPRVEQLWCVDPHCEFQGLPPSWPDFLKWQAEADIRNIITIRQPIHSVTNILPLRFNFVYIDGCHDYEEVVKDLKYALRVCSLIALHDYGCDHYGVRKAVDGAVAEGKCTIIDRAGSMVVITRVR